MDRQNILFTFISIAVATLFAYIILFWTNHTNLDKRKPLKEVSSEEYEVLVAAENLPLGRKIQHLDVRWQVWPKNAVSPEFAYKSTRELSNFLGAVVRQPISKGQPILDSDLVQPAHRGFLASIIKPGMRAISLEVDQATGVAGFVFPGDFVDILLNATETAAGDKSESKTLLTSIFILAIDQSATRESAEEAKLVKTVTLEVTPEQAELLISSKMKGTLSLSLQGLAEPSPSKTTNAPPSLQKNDLTSNLVITQSKINNK